MENSRMTKAALAGFGLRDDVRDLVGHAAEEQIASLAAHVARRRGEATAQLLLQRPGVLVDALGNRILLRVGPRLVVAVVRVAVKLATSAPG
jgi:hypothetical protein